MVDIPTIFLYNVCMNINSYEIIYKDLDSGRLCKTHIKAKSFVSAKMKFTDQGYGPLINIVEVIQKDVK